MRILVMSDFWKAHELWVLPSDSIGTLRQAIMNELCLTEEKMKERLLVLDDRNLFLESPLTLLADGCDLFERHRSTTTLDACGIKAGSTLRLGWKGLFRLSIVIDTDVDYITEEIKVSCYDTIKMLHPKVVEVTGEPITGDNFPRVLLSQEDHRTLLSLGYYKLSENGNPKPRIFRNRENVLPMANPEYNGEVTRHISGQIQITFEIPNLPLPLPYLCMATERVEHLKMYIPGMCMRDTRVRLPAYLMDSRFVLFLRDKELDDDSATLEECGIQHMHSLKLFEDADFLLDIRSELHNLHQFDVQFKCFHTIGKLREKLQNLTRIPKDEIRLTYKEWHLDDNDRHFVDYVTREMEPGFRPIVNLVRRIVIHPSLPSAEDQGEEPMPKHGKLDHHHTLPPFVGEKWIQIVVELPNMPWRFPLNVEPTSTVSDVKSAIVNKKYFEDAMLLGQRYIKEGKFVLVCGRKDLENESLTLADYGIGHMVSIQLLESSCFGITISAPCLGLRGYVLQMRGFDTVRMLKEKLWEVGRLINKEKDLPHVGYALDCFHILVFLDDDDRRLVDYGIAKHVEYDDESLVCINPKIHGSWNLRKERHRICVSPSMFIANGALLKSSLYG